MQTHGGANAEQAILASERDITVSLRVDWNRNGAFDHVLSDLTPYVSNVSLDKALSGSTPEDILLVEGNAAAELEVTMGGQYQSLQLPSVFSPFNTQSPLYGQVMVGADVEYDIIVQSPLGRFVYPQFRGFVRTITPVRGSNDVTLTALDRAEILRSPVQLVPWAISEQHLDYGELDSVSITSEWVIDNCLRLCDVSTTPYRPTFWEELGVDDWGLDGVQVYITGNGGYLPTVGWLDNLNADTFANPGHAMYSANAPRHPGAVGVEGPDPRGLNGLGDGISDERRPNSEGYLHYWALDRDKINPQGSHYVAFTLNRQSDLNLNNIDETPLIEVCIGGHYYLYILIRDGQIRARRRYSTGTEDSVRDFQTDWMTIPSGDHIDIHAAWDNTQETGARIWLGARATGTTTWLAEEGNWSTATGDPVENDYSDANYLKGRLKLGQAVGMSDIVYATRNVYSASLSLLEQSTVRKAKYSAVVDRGINRLGFMPFREARDAWDIICDVAGAEFGSVFFDENGVFRFWNWDRMLEKQQDPVRTFTLDEVEGLALTASLDSVRNVITVQATSKRAVFGNVWASGDLEEFVVPAGGWIEKKIWVDDILSPIPFRLGHDDDEPNQWRWEGTGTRGWHVWDADRISHGYVLSFWSDSRGRWEEHSEWEGGFVIDQYFAGDGFLTVRMGSSWDRPVRPATAQFTYDPENSNSDDQGYRDVGGETPAYHIGGTYIKDYGEVSVFTRSRESMMKYGARNLELKGDWYHDTTVMPDSNGHYPVVERIMRRVEEPLPTTDDITIAGDPRLQLGDAISIVDPDGFGDEMTMQILGINREWDIEDGLTDTLTVHMYRLIHDRPPSNVDAGPDVHDWAVDATFTRTGTYNPGDGTAVESQWKIIAGTDRINEWFPGPTLVFEPGEEGWWRFEFKVSTEFGEATDIFELHTEGSTTGYPAHAGEAMWIGDDPGKNHFKIDIGLGNTGGTDDLTLEQEDIEEGTEVPGKFFLTHHPVEGPVVEYRINAGASRTTSGTSYPRSEHREVAADGNDNFGWDGEGTHYMKWRAGVVQFHPERSWICIGQIHDANMDKVRIQTEGNGDTGLDLVVRWNPTREDGGEQRTPLIDNGYNLGDFHDFEIRVEDDILIINLDGEEVFRSPGPMLIEGGYFKYGNYLQVSPDKQPGADPDAEGAVQVVAGSLEVWHDGYPEPSPPAWTGEAPEDPGGGQPATFGKTSAGSSSSDSNASRVMVSRAVPQSTGVVQTGHAWLGLSGSAATSQSSTMARFAIYSDDGGMPGDLLAVSEEIEISGLSLTLREFEFPSNQQITVTQGTPYWIGPGWLDADPSSANAIAVSFGRDGTDFARKEANIGTSNWPDFPEEFGTPVAENDGPMAAYVTYTQSSGFSTMAARTVEEPEGPILAPAPPSRPSLPPLTDATESPVVPPEEPIIPDHPDSDWAPPPSV